MNNGFLNIHDLILALAALEALLLSLALKLIPTNHRQPRNLLAVFFFLVAGMLVTTLIIWNGYLQTLEIARWDLLPLLLSVCMLLQWPTLYLYLQSLSRELQLLHWKNLAHLVPAVIVGAVILIADIDIVDWLPWNRSLLSPMELHSLEFVWAIVKCSPLGYLVACFYAEYRLRQQLKQVYSSISAYDLRLADIVLGGFFICWLWSFVAYFLGAYISQEINHWLGVLNNYLNVILINTLFIFGFSNTRQLLTVHVEATPNIDKVIELPKLRGKIAAIENGIHNQKLYLESNINLERFSERIGLRAREVSTVLNAHYQSNFFEFINGYRITEAKRILVEEDATVLDVLYRCGFNSQSAFHRFFKRLTGVTPSEYRQQQASENQK